MPNPSNGSSGRGLRADPDHLSSYLSPLGFHSRRWPRESALCNETSRAQIPATRPEDIDVPPFRPHGRGQQQSSLGYRTPDDRRWRTHAGSQMVSKTVLSRTPLQIWRKTQVPPTPPQWNFVASDRMRQLQQGRAFPPRRADPAAAGEIVTSCCLIPLWPQLPRTFAEILTNSMVCKPRGLLS